MAASYKLLDYIFPPSMPINLYLPSSNVESRPLGSFEPTQQALSPPPPPNSEHSIELQGKS